MKLRAKRRIIAKIKNKSRIGPRCRDYWPECVVCQCWAFYDLNGRFPHTSLEAERFVLGGE